MLFLLKADSDKLDRSMYFQFPLYVVTSAKAAFVLRHFRTSENLMCWLQDQSQFLATRLGRSYPSHSQFIAKLILFSSLCLQVPVLRYTERTNHNGQTSSKARRNLEDRSPLGELLRVRGRIRAIRHSSRSSDPSKPNARRTFRARRTKP